MRMPLIQIQTSATAPADPEPLLRDLSRELASLLGKPERYVMVALNGAVPMRFGGESTPCCCVRLTSIGQLDGDQPRRISAAVCSLLERHLSVPSARIYIGFEDVPARMWGWDGDTFG